MQHSQAWCFFSHLLSCTCYSRSCLGNSAVALLFITVFELRCRFTFFLASVTNNNGFSSFNAEAKRSSGGRSALDNCPKNTQLPVGQLYVKAQEHCFLMFPVWDVGHGVRPRMSALLDQTKDPCRLLQVVFPVAPAAWAKRAHARFKF